MNRALGHFWTFAPFIGHAIAPSVPPPSRLVRAVVDDPRRGPVPVTGRLSAGAVRRDTLCVIVHGLGGSSASYYTIRAAVAADALGMDSLRLNVRGADRSGADVAHAALVEDLAAVLGHPDLRDYTKVLLLGFSLGGHLVLRYATEDPDPRVAAVAAICAPIDLEAGCAEIDRPERFLYRRHLLSGLKEIYRAVAARSSFGPPLEEVLRIDRIADWDDAVVAPRFGFRDARDYWRRATVGPLLPLIEIPALFVCSEHDPMVMAHTVLPSLARAPQVETFRVSQAGHVGFPPNLDVPFGTTGPVERRAIEWLGEKGAPRPTSE